MKRLLVGLGAAVGLVALTAASVPWLTMFVAAREGVIVGTAGWCAEGVCFGGVRVGEARAERVVVAWDRVVRAEGVRVPVSEVVARAGSAGGGTSGRPGLLAQGVRAVDVVDLRVDGTPLPALSGRVWPERDLSGEGVSIAGDTVRATVPSPFGDLAIEATRGEGVDLVVRCEAFTLPAPSDADAPLRLPAVSARGTWDAGRFEGSVRVADVEARVSATVEGTGAVGVAGGGAGGAGGGPAVVADVVLPPTPIASVYALFAPWVPELRRAHIEGTFAASGRVRWSGAVPGGAGVAEGGVAEGGPPAGEPAGAAPAGVPAGAAPAGVPAGAAVAGAVPVEEGLTVVSFAPVVDGFTVDGLVPDALAGGRFQFRGRDPSGADTLFTRGEGTSEWVPLAEMGPWLPAAVIAAEDAGFRAHTGYDLDGMREAAARNEEEGDIVRGGSTLTQQLAKNLFLDGTRSYARKLRELLYAVEMERELGKPRILTLYLNSVEFGPGIRGARAAAETYFLKSPAGLLPEEAAWLASILRFPKTAYTRQYLAGNVDASRVRWILENLRGVPEDARVAALGRTVRLVPP